MRYSRLCLLLLLSISVPGTKAFALRKAPVAAATHLRNALTNLTQYRQLSPASQPGYVRISLADDDPRHRRPGPGKRDWNVAGQPKANRHNVGVGLLVGGIACLLLSAVLFAYASNPNHFGRDGVGSLTLMGGVLLGATGLGMFIPGLVFALKYPKRNN